MAEAQGITAELYRAIVTIVDDRVKEIRVTREDFDRLTQTVAQLAQAQARTEQRLEELAQAQARTEQALQQLATQVGALSDNVGYGLEDIARVVRRRVAAVAQKEYNLIDEKGG